jgi:hypothetical protein
MRLQIPVAAALAFATLLHPAGAGAESAEKPDRRVKVVVHGGSVSAYGLGGYGQWLPAACKQIDVVNTSKARLSAAALRARFVSQVLGSASIEPKTQETWLLFLGGLNSINSPELTNFDVARTFELAHKAGFRTMGLTIGPWGSEGDSRWKEAEGLVWFAKTQKAVDFVMGRLTPVEAFGERAAEQSSYRPGQLPDVAIELWDSSLRAQNAPLRPRQQIEPSVKRSRWVKSQLAGLDESAREQALEDWIARAAALPQWFLRPELIGSDPVHPNSEGHKQIARTICDRAPASWGCDCSVYDGLVWHEGLRKPIACSESSSPRCSST